MSEPKEGDMRPKKLDSKGIMGKQSVPIQEMVDFMNEPVAYEVFKNGEWVDIND